MDQVFVVLGAESEGQQTLDGPLTTGLARVSRTVPGLVPWAWAINGCASVVSAVLATLLAIHIGFSGVVLAAVALYGLAAVAAPMINAENAASR